MLFYILNILCICWLKIVLAQIIEINKNFSSDIIDFTSLKKSEWNSILLLKHVNQEMSTFRHCYGYSSSLFQTSSILDTFFCCMFLVCLDMHIFYFKLFVLFYFILFIKRIKAH